MQAKNLVIIGVVALGVTAVGGVLLWGGGDRERSQPAAGDGALWAKGGAAEGVDNFGGVSGEADGPERAAISTSGRGAATAQGGFGGMSDIMSRLAEFDADGDGILSDEERDAMRRAMREEWMARMDLDGDGEISREERMAARQRMFEESSRGQDLMRQFDADGNGVLDEAEQAAMDAHLQAQRDQRRQEEIARWDMDGDGELSRDERRAQREQQGERRDDFMRGLTDEFDLDGDGRLSIEESENAWATMQARREIDGFISRYDRDGDGRMGPGDYDAFLSDYSRGDLRADVNGDGVVNSADVTAYTDMVTRSRNRP